MKAIQTKYDGHKFRSRVEARWAVFFNALGWNYQYELEGFEVEGTPYLPDFYLPELSMWFEVKGSELTEPEADLCRKFSAGSGNRVVAALGAPKRGELYLRLFDARSDGDLCCFLADRRNEGQFWLGSVDEGSPDHWAMSIGPIYGPSHDREPIHSSTLNAAIDAANSARFEHGEKG